MVAQASSTVPDLREWLTPDQAARRLNLSAQRVVQLADRGQLRAVRTALGRLIDPASVAELAAIRARSSDRR